VSGSGKVGFAAGLCVGLLVGSRSGRGLYDKSAATASALMHDPRVRQGATTAAHRAGEAGSAAVGVAARQVKRVRGSDEDEDERDTRDASMTGSGMGMRSGKSSDEARAAARAAGARDASSGMDSRHAAPAASTSSARGKGMANGEPMGGHERSHGHGHHGHGHGTDSAPSAQPRQTGMADGKAEGKTGNGKRDASKDERAD